MRRSRQRIGLTVESSLSSPIADLLDILVYGYVLAPSALERYDSGDTTRPVGTGPYRMTEAVSGQEVRLERFGGWHGTHRPMSRSVSSSSRILQNAWRHCFRVMHKSRTSLDFRASMIWKREHHTRAISLVPVAIIYLFNAARGPLGDPRVRRALNLAVDRMELVDGVVHGAAKALTGFVSPATSEAIRPPIRGRILTERVVSSPKRDMQTGW